MQTLKFQMTDNGTTVAEGTASTVMVSEFQLAFANSIGGNLDRIHFHADGYQTLSQLLALNTGQAKGWQAISADGRAYGFYCERIN